MRLNKNLILIIISFILLSSCISNKVEKTVSISDMNPNGIYFSYEYLDNRYKGYLPLNIWDRDFSISDSLKIRIDKEVPSKYEFISIIYRIVEEKEEYAFVPINNNSNSVYGYADCDQKPLFEGAFDAYDNGSITFSVGNN